jgi:hypothetical protein
MRPLCFAFSYLCWKLQFGRLIEGPQKPKVKIQNPENFTLGSWRFIAAFTTASHWPLFWVILIHRTHLSQSLLRSILWSHPPIYSSVLRVVSFLRAFPPKHYTLSVISHTCHMSYPPHSPWLDLPNDICGWVQIMKLLIVRLTSQGCI